MICYIEQKPLPEIVPPVQIPENPQPQPPTVNPAEVPKTPERPQETPPMEPIPEYEPDKE